MCIHTHTRVHACIYAHTRARKKNRPAPKRGAIVRTLAEQFVRIVVAHDGCGHTTGARQFFVRGL